MGFLLAVFPVLCLNYLVLVLLYYFFTIYVYNLLKENQRKRIFKQFNLLQDEILCQKNQNKTKNKPLKQNKYNRFSIKMFPTCIPHQAHSHVPGSVTFREMELLYGDGHIRAYL